MHKRVQFSILFIALDSDTGSVPNRADVYRRTDRRSGAYVLLQEVF